MHQICTRCRGKSCQAVLNLARRNFDAKQSEGLLSDRTSLQLQFQNDVYYKVLCALLTYSRLLWTHRAGQICNLHLYPVLQELQSSLLPLLAAVQISCLSSHISSPIAGVPGTISSQQHARQQN